MIPEFEPFKRNGKRQDVLSSEELTALFPYNEKELIKIWKRPDDMRKERDEIALMFGTLFCVTVSAGLRSGEIRALNTEQISIANSGFVIDHAVDDRGRIRPVKKATADDTRSRAIIIPEITLRILEHAPFGRAILGEKIRRCPYCDAIASNTLKVLSAVLAERANKIIRQSVAFIYISAYFADESLFVSFRRLGLGSYIIKVILICYACVMR